MKTITISAKFDGQEDDSAILRFLGADAAYRALEEIRHQVFRPARKHGYPDKRINDLLERIDAMEPPSEDGGPATSLVGHLEELFFEILREYHINLDDA